MFSITKLKAMQLHCGMLLEPDLKYDSAKKILKQKCNSWINSFMKFWLLSGDTFGAFLLNW